MSTFSISPSRLNLQEKRVTGQADSSKIPDIRSDDEKAEGGGIIPPPSALSAY
ncbi:MAG: hypothetical protein WCF57_19210 [Pyrinomonadaceae bacterium]